jgi:hypothetical protein
VKWDEVIMENKKGKGGGGMAHVAIFRGKMYEFAHI